MVSKSDLIRFIEKKPPEENFTPYCRISEEADALTVYFEDESDYSERLSDHITLYRSLDGGQIVGCRIKGISGILKDLPKFFIHVEQGKVRLAAIFFAFRGGAEGEVSEAVNSLAVEATKREMILEPIA